jgi:hypothetical protein
MRMTNISKLGVVLTATVYALGAPSLHAQNPVIATPIAEESRLPVAVDSARAVVAARRDEAIQAVILTVKGSGPKTSLVADGVSKVPVTIRVFDVNGGPLSGRRVARVSADGASLQRVDSAEDCRIEETGRRCANEEVLIVDGEGVFAVVAPSSAREVFVTATVGGHPGRVKLAFATETRPLVAAGLVEMMVGLSSVSTDGSRGSSLSDAFERDLRRWESRFNNGKGSIAGRSSFFLKGTTTNGYLVSAMFDSEKDLRTREFSDFNPDRYYPVMGDSSQRGYEAESSDRLYVRVDKGRGYFLYGDFATGANFSLGTDGARMAPLSVVDLGQYNRTMTGLRWHQRADAGFVDAWGMRDSLRQAIEEYRGNGTSGPFAIANYNALENSEKLEVIVRDRNNTSRVLSVEALERYTDYNFEPFSGRVVLKAPLPSLDAELNPVSLRITYEVDTGGEEFWAYGLSAQRRLTPWLQAGLVYVMDDNPGRPMGSGYVTTPGNGAAELRELRAANLAFDTGDFGQLVVELAEVDSVTALADLSGSAWRVDWRLGQDASRAEQGKRWSLRFFAGEADEDFINPSSTLAPGRSEVAVEGAAELGTSARVSVNASQTEDAFTGGERTGASVQLERDVTDRVALEMGIRHFSQRRGGVWSLSPFSGSSVLPGQGPAYGGSGLNPNGAGFWGMGVGLNPFTGQPQSAFNGSPILTPLKAPDADVTSYSIGVNTRLNDAWVVGVAVGQDRGFEDDPVWGALTSDYRTRTGRAFARLEAPTGRATAGLEYAVSEGTSVYGRWEETTAMGSAYSLENSIEGRALALGVRSAIGEETAGFSEMRMREGMSERDLESVTGIQRSFVVSDQMEVTVLAERLEILSGNSRSATALGGGVAFGDRLWQGDARVEWRRLDADPAAKINNTADSLMSTVSFARKMGGDWTGLLRNYALVTDDRGRAGAQMQNRFQIGAAYRPIYTNDFDLLFRYENKIERNSELVVSERRRVDIVSANVNFHPRRSVWLSGRVAAKDVSETLVNVEDDYRAWLFASRIILDVSSKFDVSAMAGVMVSPEDNVRDEVYGLEVGYLIKENIWLSLGHNFSGFYDRDLSGRDPTQSGWYIRMRMKFDEKLLKSAED